MTFTNLRWPVPKPAGQPHHDALLKALNDYWLSLEKPGALNIMARDLPALKLVNVEDYLQPANVTDHSVGLRAAAAQIIEQNGGVLWFKPGKTYSIWGSDTARILDFRGVTGHITIIGNGAIIASALTDDSTGASLIDVTACAGGIHVTGLDFRGGNDSLRAAGEHFLLGANGTKNVLVENCKIQDCQAGVNFYGPGYDYPNANLIFRNNICTRVYYPLNIYQTDNICAEYQSINGGRSAFLAAPISNFYISVDSQQGGPFSDIEMIVYADVSKTAAQNTISNGRINYRTSGRYSGSGDVNTGTAEACVHFILKQYDADSSAGHFRDIDVDICADCGASDQYANAVLFNRYKSDGTLTADGTSRTHTIRNITISGHLLDWGNAKESGIVLFPVTTVNSVTMAWTGDLIENIAIRDFTITGTAPTYPVYINGQGAVSGKVFCDVQNCSVGGTITLDNVAGVQIVGLPVPFTPSLTFGGTATGMTYAARAASSMITNTGVVHFWGQVALSAKGSATGNAYIEGLPFTSRNNTDSISPVALYLYNTTFANQYQALINSNTAAILLAEITEAGTVSNLTNADFIDSSAISFSGSYRY